MTLDDLDHRILRHLETDARQSNAVIARAVGVSEATVRRRIKNLIKEQALFISAVPEPGKFGFNLSALVGFNVEPNSLDLVSAKLIACPEITFLGSATGRFDLVAEVIVKDQDDLRLFLARLSKEIPRLSETEAIAFLRPRPGSAGRIAAPQFSRADGAAQRSRRSRRWPEGRRETPATTSALSAAAV